MSRYDHLVLTSVAGFDHRATNTYNPFFLAPRKVRDAAGCTSLAVMAVMYQDGYRVTRSGPAASLAGSFHST